MGNTKKATQDKPVATTEKPVEHAVYFRNCLQCGKAMPENNRQPFCNADCARSYKKVR